jgi:DNA-binding NarL/FixJ family response regulator
MGPRPIDLPRQQSVVTADPADPALPRAKPKPNRTKRTPEAATTTVLEPRRPKVSPGPRPRRHRGRISVVLVDDHDLIRRGLRHAFDRTGQFDVVGEAGTAADGIRLATMLRPDVVIMDVQLPDGSGLDAAGALRDALPTVGIVVLSTWGEDDVLFAAMEAGASAFVPKSAPVTDVIAVVRYAASAPTSFTADNLAAAMQRRLAPKEPQLTALERQVLTLLADGTSVAGIARQLFVSNSTAKHLVTRLVEKLGASNRTQALMAALRMGLLHTETHQTGDHFG